MNKEEKLAKQKKKRATQIIAILALALTVAGLILPMIISITGAM